MALRYSRKIRPDRVSGERLKKLAHELLTFLRDKLATHLRAEHQWHISEVNPGELEAVNATMTCKALFRLDSDMGADACALITYR